jgi:hypothetical protein
MRIPRVAKARPWAEVGERCQRWDSGRRRQEAVHEFLRARIILLAWCIILPAEIVKDWPAKP